MNSFNRKIAQPQKPAGDASKQGGTTEPRTDAETTNNDTKIDQKTGDKA
jgi:hypothetical protein